VQDVVYSRALQRASEIKGGTEALAAHLGVPGERLRLWQKGLAPIPTDVFLRIVDILVEDSVGDLDDQSSLAPRRKTSSSA